MVVVASSRSGRTRWAVLTLIGIACLLIAVALVLVLPRGSGSRTPRPFVVNQGATSLTSFACVSAQRCYGSEGGAILASASRGVQWHAVVALPGADISSIWCDPRNGCQALATTRSGLVALSTVDGQRWTVAHSISSQEGEIWIARVECATQRLCWAGGGMGRSNDPGLMLKSSNAGSTWQREILPAGVAAISDIHCFSSTRCIAIAGVVPAQVPMGAGTNGFEMLLTTNGGQQWHIRFRSWDDSPGSLSCVGPRSCWMAVGPGIEQVPGKTTPLLRSDDGGATWHVVHVESSRYPGTLDCVTRSTCWSIGVARVGRSVDGGESWTVMKIPKASDVNFNWLSLACPTTTSCDLLTSSGPESVVVLTKVSVADAHRVT